MVSIRRPHDYSLKVGPNLLTTNRQRFQNHREVFRPPVLRAQGQHIWRADPLSWEGIILFALFLSRVEKPTRRRQMSHSFLFPWDTQKITKNACWVVPVPD